MSETIPGYYEHRNPECTWHNYTQDRGLKKPSKCVCARRVWVAPAYVSPPEKTGKITAMASTERPGQVEIIMSNGEDAAITYMSPERALQFCMDVMGAAQIAAAR